MIAFSFSIIISLGITFEKIFQSVGRMKATMASMLCGCVANIVLDPVLIFGLGPFPEMGIRGAALATGIGQVLTLVIYLVFYFVRPFSVRIRRSCLHLQKDMVLRLYSIGIPATLNLALPSILISALNAILAAYSEVYILVLGIYYKLQTFLYLPANGLVQGMRPIIGYNYGAREYRRVNQIYNLVLGMSAVIMAAGTVICLTVPGQLMGLFTQTPETIRAGETALRVISAGFLVSAVSVASSGGAGRSGKRLALAADLALPLSCDHHSGGVPAQQTGRPGGGLERVLGGGSGHRCDCVFHLPEGSGGSRVRFISGLPGRYRLRCPAEGYGCKVFGRMLF